MTQPVRLDAELARLPRGLPPARDLWPAIDAATRPHRRLRWPAPGAVS